MIRFLNVLKSLERCGKVMFIIIVIYQFDTRGCTQKARSVEVLIHSQGNLEAKGEPRTTNMGQIM